MHFTKFAYSGSLLIVGLGLTVNGYSQSFLTNGLVAYYPFNGNALDASGNGHNGIINGTSIAPTNNQLGILNAALHFGGGSYISITPTPFNVNSNWTISLWCILDAPINNANNFVSTGNDASGALNIRYADEGSPSPWQAGAGSIGIGCPAAATNNPNSWNMLTCVWNGYSWQLFLDNSLVCSNATVETTVDTGALWFGMQESGFSYALFGALSDVRIYNRALSTNEVAELYAYESTPPLSFLTNGLVAYYPFNGNANDAVGTNNGTVYGATLTTNRFGLLSSAYFFDGAEAYIQMAEPLPDMQSASFSAWITFPTVGTDRQDIIFEGDPTYGDDFRLSLQGDDADFVTKDNTLVSSGPMLDTNTWYQVVGIADSSTGLNSLWVNGDLVASNSNLGNANVGYHYLLQIGRLDDGSQARYYFNGTVSDVRFYNRALLASEVQELYAYESTPQPTTPPSITSQPQPVIVNAHSNASFCVTASGTTPLNYQWSFNGANISGATASSLAITNVDQNDLGAYAVVITNSVGTVTSSNAVLSMYPFLSSPFAGVVTDWGYNATLSVQAWGSGPLSYQWLDNGVAIQNATNQTLTLASIQFTNAGLYSVVVSSPFGSVTNTPEQVVVNPAGVALGMYPGVTVTGTVGYTYAIQATADLSNTNSWTTVATMTLMQPIQLWVDFNVNALSPTNPHKYYRVTPGD